ncbi:MAG: phosphotransferase, partial [Elusimicrobia bacterium]|nr:phosphotransferase [Elusimicrobiota bacterium]
TAKDKRSIRDRIRRLPGGDDLWQRLQAVVYGPKMAGARLIPGAEAFLKSCRRHGVPVHIVSQKLSRYPLDPTRTDFRAAARRWMRRNRFFMRDGLGLDRSAVNFVDSRRDKVRRIRRLGCTHFIDDLEETFREDGFPKSVARILYSPNHGVRRLPGVRVARSWDDIHARLFAREAAAGRLLGRTAVGLEPLGRGRNSQVYLASARDGSRCAVKFYFRHPADRRDRLATEFASLRFLWDSGLRCIPRPLAADPQSNCAAYEFIDGRPVAAGDVTLRDVDNAVAFLRGLQGLAQRRLPRLAPASEACFSPQAIAGSIQSRLDRLRRVCRGRTPEGRLLAGFLSREFLPLRREILRWSSQELAAAGLSWDQRLPWRQRTLSPSDFGFHNALRTGGGRIKFLDFEYFGWDDPAKTVCDFLLHPAMRLRPALKRRFLEGALRAFGGSRLFRRRVRAVYPLFGLKWCLILLNEFVPEHRRRRDFAGAQSGDVCARQLAKARRMLAKMRREYRSFPPHA